MEPSTLGRWMSWWDPLPREGLEHACCEPFSLSKDHQAVDREGNSLGSLPQHSYNPSPFLCRLSLSWSSWNQSVLSLLRCVLFTQHLTCLSVSAVVRGPNRRLALLDLKLWRNLATHDVIWTALIWMNCTDMNGLLQSMFLQVLMKALLCFYSYWNDLLH